MVLMKKIFILLFISCSPFILNAQTAEDRLAAHYCFDNCNSMGLDCSPKGAKAQLSVVPAKCTCGINGGAAQLNGNEYITLINVYNKLNTSNFSLSFYFKPLGSIGTREIFSNRDTCDQKRVFSVSYNASARIITVLLKDEKRSATLIGKLDNSACWQHVTVTRESNYHRLYMNGKLVATSYSADNQRINLASNTLLYIGKSACHPNIPGGQFRGVVDEVRFYENFALKEEEVKSLYKRPDRILTNDQVLFIGNGVNTEITSTCGSKFSWSPTDGVANPTAAVTKITPPKDGIYNYVLRFNDSTTSCTAYDTLRLTVIDPTNQPCGEVYIPNAFTPNGDGNNETFGINNPYTIGDLVVFEILDRWGGKVFTTSDAFQQWDGKINDKAAMPGEYLYRIRYKCQGEEKNKIGSFFLLQ